MASLEACHAVTRDAWLAVQREIMDEKTSATVIPVRDAPGKLLAFARAHRYSVAPEQSRRYVLYVRPLQWADTDALGTQLENLFRLTAAESRFAIALRRLGDLAHAAAAVGIAESSARTRLQSIFEKIDVHRLSDLLLLIDALAEVVT
ncbi:MAG TPA: hypothetical protein VK753_03225 [Xanthomonadaceae bacterium]|nr:hypothetical protein [Xanthomonadaceae bacterium]